MRRTTRREVRSEDLAGMTAAQYIRDSTADQAEGFGPEMQRRANRTFATRYGLKDTGLMYEEYVSAGSVHGRSELLRALADMRVGRFRVLLVGWTHRFARSTEDAERVKREIADSGGILVYSAQGIISGQKTTRISEKVHHILDEEYRENLADLVAAGLLAKYESGGANGHPPLGSRHVYIRRDGTIAHGPERHTRAVRVLDEATLPALRDLLTHYSESGSYRDTASWMNARGHQTRRGNAFTFSSVEEIVRNPYYGPGEIVRYHSKHTDPLSKATPEAEHIFPAALHELWTRCQTRRGRYSSVLGTVTRVYPLHPVLRCETCASVYHGQSTRGTRLSRHADALHGCAGPRSVPSESLEDQLAAVLREVTLPRNWRRQILRLTRAPTVDTSAQERDRLTRRLERLRYQHLCEAIDDATFARDARALRQEMDAIAPSAPPLLDSYREPADLLRSIGAIIGHPSVRRRADAQAEVRRFCELAFTQITVDGRRLASLHPRPRYADLFAVALAGESVVWCGREDLNLHPLARTWT